MSSRYRSPSRDSRDSRRESSSSSRHRDRDRESSRRGSSPGPSRGRSPPKPPRDEKDLPESFGRGQEERKDDDLTVLQRMKSSFNGSPLFSINKCVDGSRKLKVWTRNFKEVRGICTGYIIAFDKHWNLIMRDIDEVFLKPRKAKTPFLRDLKGDESIQEMEPKVPRVKNPEAHVEEARPVEPEPEPEPEPKPESSDAKASETPVKKRRKKKKKGPTTERRHCGQMFIRGDNIVMIAIVNVNGGEEHEEETSSQAE